MPILLAGTIEIVHIEQVSALFTFRLGQVLLYYRKCFTMYLQDCIHPFSQLYSLIFCIVKSHLSAVLEGKSYMDNNEPCPAIIGRIHRLMRGT
jgi:hypothetical protein